MIGIERWYGMTEFIDAERGTREIIEDVKMFVKPLVL
jgi:hypothetical protein